MPNCLGSEVPRVRSVRRPCQELALQYDDTDALDNDSIPYAIIEYFSTMTYSDYFNDNSSGRSAIYRLPTQKLLAVDRIFIYGFVSLISVVTGNGNPLHFKSIPVGKPTASYLLTRPKPVLLSGPAYIVSGPSFAVIGLL